MPRLRRTTNMILSYQLIDWDIVEFFHNLSWSTWFTGNVFCIKKIYLSGCIYFFSRWKTHVQMTQNHMILHQTVRKNMCQIPTRIQKTAMKAMIPNKENAYFMMYPMTALQRAPPYVTPQHLTWTFCLQEKFCGDTCEFVNSNLGQSTQSLERIVFRLCVQKQVLCLCIWAGSYGKLSVLWILVLSKKL